MSKPKKHLQKVKTPIGAWVIFLFLAVYAIALMIPYLFALVTSFRSINDFREQVFGWSAPTLENYQTLFDTSGSGFKYTVITSDGAEAYYDFIGLMVNSFLFAIGCAAANTICPCIVGYCTARFPYKFSNFLISLVYVLMALPIVGSTVSEIQMTQTLGIYDTIPGMWFLKFSFLGMYTLIYNASFKGIPNDYVEAAYMDGAGNMSIFVRIMLPLVSNTMLIAFILSFVSFWSDYGTPLYFLRSYPTLALALLNYTETVGTYATDQMAACILLCIPSLVLFACFTEKFTGNLQMGGIKG